MDRVRFWSGFWQLHRQKKQSQGWPKHSKLKMHSTEVVMTAEVFFERALFRKEFPYASHLICLFHTMRSMMREETCKSWVFTLVYMIILLRYSQSLCVPNQRWSTHNTIRHCLILVYNHLFNATCTTPTRIQFDISGWSVSRVLTSPLERQLTIFWKASWSTSPWAQTLMSFWCTVLCSKWKGQSIIFICAFCVCVSACNIWHLGNEML